VCLIAGFVAGLSGGAVGAAALPPGEYSCFASGGSILIGLGFKLEANGSYTDLDGKSRGRVTYSDSNVTFVGGHLDGEVGKNRVGNVFNIHNTKCMPFK
jgi:hypothetical protein